VTPISWVSSGSHHPAPLLLVVVVVVLLLLQLHQLLPRNCRCFCLRSCSRAIVYSFLQVKRLGQHSGLRRSGGPTGGVGTWLA
jgi:hypothetical protein